MKGAAIKLIAKSLPDAYFKNEAEVRAPKAPLWALFSSFFFENVAGMAVLIFFVIYFQQQSVPITTISPTILASQDCSALVPKKGTTYYSKVNSENAQFSSPTQRSDECNKLLTTLNVCADNARHDILQVYGPSNPRNIKFASSGYLTFTVGSSASALAPSFSSVSFPKPAYGGSTFSGSSTLSYPDQKKVISWLFVYNYGTGAYLQPTTSIDGGEGGERVRVRVRLHKWVSMRTARKERRHELSGRGQIKRAFGSELSMQKKNALFIRNSSLGHYPAH
jgi:hypothetical protein